MVIFAPGIRSSELDYVDLGSSTHRCWIKPGLIQGDTLDEKKRESGQCHGEHQALRGMRSEVPSSEGDRGVV